MIMKYYLIFFGFIFIVLSSCEKDDKYYSPYLVETYAKYLDSLDLHCPDGESDIYFEGMIKGQQVCYKDGIENYVFKYKFFSSVVTDSPNLVVGSKYTGLLYQIVLAFEPIYPRPNGKESLNIKFPYFDPNRDTVEFLDSLFSINKHRLKSINDGNEMVRNKTKFEVDLMMVDRGNHGERGNAFLISTIYGKQSSSFVTINKVERNESDDKVFYSLEMTINCKLYHNPLFKKEGLWGEIEDGHVVANLLIEK